MARTTVLALAIAVVAAIVVWPGGADAMRMIEVSPSEGPLGMTVTISGTSFKPNETVFVEFVSEDGDESHRFATIIVSDGTKPGTVSGEFEFTAEIGLHEERIDFPPGEYIVLAYPEELGERTEETIAASPQAPFTITASELPAAGGQPSETSREVLLVVAGALAAMLGTAAVAIGLRRSRS